MGIQCAFNPLLNRELHLEGSTNTTNASLSFTFPSLVLGVPQHVPRVPRTGGSATRAGSLTTRNRGPVTRTQGPAPHAGHLTARNRGPSDTEGLITPILTSLTLLLLPKPKPPLGANLPVENRNMHKKVCIIFHTISNKLQCYTFLDELMFTDSC